MFWWGFSEHCAMGSVWLDLKPTAVRFVSVWWTNVHFDRRKQSGWDDRLTMLMLMRLPWQQPDERQALMAGAWAVIGCSCVPAYLAAQTQTRTHTHTQRLICSIKSLTIESPGLLTGRLCLRQANDWLHVCTGQRPTDSIAQCSV